MLNSLEDVCETKRGWGPCVFPFKEKSGGKVHHKCAKWTLGRTWCAFEVDDNDVMKTDKWAQCGSAKRCRGRDQFQTTK